MFKVGDKVVVVTHKNSYIDPFGSITTIIDVVGFDYGDIYKTSSGLTYSQSELKKYEKDKKQSSDGGSTDYYNIPKGAKDIGDLINYKNMNFNIGNVFKACWRKGEKNGVSEEYDLRKMAFFVKSELERIGGKYDDIYK